ncbi:MAG: GAF domain-containing sensor histidine kinase [Actinomycetota bacterium]
MTDRVQDRDRADLLIEAGLALAAERSLEAVLQRIVELAVDITSARFGAITVLAPDGRIQEFVTEGITDDERAAIGDPPTGHGILGLLISEARPLRLAEIAAHPMSVGFPPDHPPMRSLLGAPVLARGKVFGNIYVTEKQGDDEFSVDDERALQVLATQAGVAVENARLYEEMLRAQDEVRRLEVMDDRERIAKELHDGVIQSLFAVGMSLQGAAALAQDEGISVRIEGAVEDIDRAIRDLRNYIFGLRPGILADRQLDQALRELGAEFEQRSEVVTVVDVDPGIAAELASIASDVVQVTREALSNVGRHADATTCRVSLRRGASGGAILVIDDDGRGFEPGSIVEGLGIGNLRDRVTSLGGSLDIQSSVGEGTTVRAVLPL